jgi:hypothetical protein
MLIEDIARAIAADRWALTAHAREQAGKRRIGDETLVSGAAGTDGMCRPEQFQEFLFVKGAFAGTISPAPMDSRSDGAVIRTNVGLDSTVAFFNRYA